MDRDEAWASYERGVRAGVVALLTGPVAGIVLAPTLEWLGLPARTAQGIGFAAAAVIIWAGAAFALRHLWPVRRAGMGQARATVTMATLCVLMPAGLVAIALHTFT